jgi:hypothetical protein
MNPQNIRWGLVVTVMAACLLAGVTLSFAADRKIYVANEDSNTVSGVIAYCKK